MAYREVGMAQVCEIVRRWLAGDGLRAIARALGTDRKTVAEYVRLALGRPPSRLEPRRRSVCRRRARLNNFQPSCSRMP